MKRKYLDVFNPIAILNMTPFLVCHNEPAIVIFEKEFGNI